MLGRWEKDKLREWDESGCDSAGGGGGDDDDIRADFGRNGAGTGLAEAGRDTELRAKRLLFRHRGPFCAGALMVEVEIVKSHGQARTRGCLSGLAQHTSCALHIPNKK